jgi:signal transduction histidine kinase
MTELVAQLLDLSRLDAEKVAIRPEPLSLRGELAAIVGATVPERAGEIRLDVSASLEAVVDRIALERIVGNLIANAYRYGEPPVVIEAAVQERELLVAVRDHGAGVPESFEPALFERFSRSEGASALSSGSGLGLAIAASYAKAHGGSLGYVAATPRGARFELRLPMQPPPIAQPFALPPDAVSVDTRA